MKKIKQLKKESYLEFIKNSAGSKSWKNFYVMVNGKKEDVLKNGDLSCAFFATSVLMIFDLIKNVHFTVKGAISDLKKSGWKEIKRPKTGAILIWEKNEEFANEHIGFYIDEKSAISNYFKKRMPFKHHITYGIKNGQPRRKIIKMFWHKKLN